MLITAFLVIALFLPSYVFAADGNEVDDIQEYVNDMQPGWNLGNTFDAVGEDETAWGNPRVTKEMIEQIAAQGFKSIRIPVTFDQRMEEGPDYTIDADFLDRVEQAVKWSLEEELYVMINIHHDSWIWLAEGMYENYDETIARYDSIWTQLADRFKNYPVELMFEGINEPQFWDDSENHEGYLKELNTSFYKIVRNSGGNNDIRPLVLGTIYNGSEQETLDKLYNTIVELDDPNLISTVHYYGFWPFSVNIAGTTRFDEETQNDIIDTFDRVHNKFTANGIPVIIGEFGLLGFDTDLNTVQQGEKLKFFEYVIHYAQEKQLTHMLWDNGQHFGRTSYQWSDPELYQMMKASWEGRSATAGSDFIFLKQGEEIVDEEIGLHLHGNEFVSLQANDQDLVEGQDYEVNGETLVLKAQLLTDLTSSGELGKNAELTAKFNQGADWRIDVITYDTSILDDAEGTTNDFSIPTQFNGDQLATMEAVYEDGSFAGPQNWTSFKEFAYTFSPVYEENKIIFKQEFFNEVEDDKEVHLTFHFWSGETVAYTVTKNGDQVVGAYHDDLDVSALADLIEIAASISNEDDKYTEESFNALQKAITQAQSVLETIATEEDLQKEITALQAAMDGLVEKEIPVPFDVSELKELIEKAEVISNDDNNYTKESFDALKKAIENAQSVVETIDNEEGLQKEIAALQDAVDGLVEEKVSVKPNVSELEDLIETGEAITNETDKYTEESFNALQEALVHAKSVVETIDTEEDLQKELALLQEAIDGLKEIEKPAKEEAEIVDQNKDNQESTPKTDDSKITDDHQAGEVLPKTATSMYTILLVGVVLLIAGGISLLFFKKRNLKHHS